MKIVDYQDVDPFKAMCLTKLEGDFPLTPEIMAHIRRTDPRLFPCVAIYAVDIDAIMGQVGIFRLPMISTEGREDIGGIWALSIQPRYSGQGVASRLLDEAHARLRQAGMRFSVLGTERFCTAYKLYLRHGYIEMNVWATGLASWETAHQPTRLRAEQVGSEGYDFVEKIFMEIAKGYLGFAWRHAPFERLRLVKLTNIWILRENMAVIGYAFVQADQTMLTITNMVLNPGIDPAEAVSAVVAELRSGYVQVKVSRPIEIASLQRAGFQIIHPTWSRFMVKPLIPKVTADDARRLFAIGTDQFLISWLDIT